jgi:hypothetical protein
VEIMRAFAELAAQQIEAGAARSATLAQSTAVISGMIGQNQPSMAYQPIYDLAQDDVAGVEAPLPIPGRGPAQSPTGGSWKPRMSASESSSGSPPSRARCAG